MIEATPSMTADQWNRRESKGARRGRVSQRAGKGFECALDAAHDQYRRAGVADLFRLPVPTQPMPKGWMRDEKRSGIGRILASRQRADYFGALGPAAGPRLNGRAVAMEAKFTSTRAASLLILEANESGGGIKLHQLESLVDGWRRFGIVGVVVWGNGTAGNLFGKCERGVFLPPALERALFEFRCHGRRRVPFTEAMPYDARPSYGPMAEPWLGPVLEYLRATASPMLTKRGARQPLRVEP